MIAVDWGSTSLRAWRLDDAGEIREQRRAAIGALDCRGRHADVLAAEIAPWNDARIVLCGAIGSRGGWHEAPYVACPATAAALAAASARVDTAGTALHGRRVCIVPGVIDRDANGVPDVMRGEETQVVGVLDVLGDEPSLLCLPGTHCKWVGVRDGAIVALRTALVGEAYALLRRHSLLAHTMRAADEPFDAAAFDEGVRRSGESGGLLHHVFAVRTRVLVDALSADAAPSYLSGILVGHDIRARLPLPPRVHLVGSARLVAIYARALAAFGAATQAHGEDAAARALFALAARAEA